MIDRVLSHYTIKASIGRGGMGEVYRARDAKLERDVALKVLPTELAGDEERLLRFEREAKVIAALNHPNIVTVYSVEEADGIHFITMELVTGKTLGELLPKRGFSLEEFFELAIPLTAAVAAAHKKGVTHRDLKPDNVMVTDDGRVKVLDFGVARPGPQTDSGGSESEALTRSAPLSMTDEGRLLGTPRYMSPEQAEGKSIDFRSDLFSLGILFYEMLSGQRPFAGDGLASTLSSIIKDEPRPLHELEPSVPWILSRVVRRCLVKTPGERFQSSEDLCLELQAIQRELAAGEGPVKASKTHDIGLPARLRRWQAIAGLVFLTGTITIVQFFLRDSSDAVPRLANPVQLTSDVGVEDDPAWSPDGSMLAYDGTYDGSMDGGNWDIWVRQSGEQEPINRSADYLGEDRYPAWSPDGRQIAFWSSRDGGGYFVTPALAGSARRISSPDNPVDYFRASRPQWSGDGAWLAYSIRDMPGSAIQVDHLTSGESRTLRLGRDFGGTGIAAYLSWSPDDKLLAFADGVGASSSARLWLLRLEDEKLLPISERGALARSPSWGDDGRSLYYISNQGGMLDLWQQRLKADGTPSGPPRAVTVGVGMQNAALSPDGRRLAYAKGRLVANIWRAPILETRVAGWADAEQITSDQAFVEHLDVTPDGTRVAFSSDRGGHLSLWTILSGAKQPQSLTFDSASDFGPNFAPDGESIAFYSLRGGNRDIWLTSVRGGAPTRLTYHPALDTYPTWSPDGQEWMFISDREGNFEIWRQSLEDVETQRITKSAGDALFPAWSPDGNWVAFSLRGEEGSSIARVPAEGGETEHVLLGGSVPRWSRDGRTLYFIGKGERTGSLWSHSLDTGMTVEITALSGRRGTLGAQALATDGRYLYFTWEESLGDIWTMDVVQGDAR